jgi:lipoprotein signal peptidase
MLQRKLYWWMYMVPLLWLMVLLWIDLWTKYLFYNLELYKDSYWIEPAMNLWISFSLQVPYIIVIPVSLIVLWIFFYLYHTKAFSKIVTLLLIAWTLGNFYDRFIYQWVRDFLVMPHMFIFNIADIFLTCGMLLALYHMLSHSQEKKQ